ARLAGGTAGRLHMAIECHSCFQWLMPTIDQFRDAWPEVELDLASGFSFAPLPALARGDLDLVVTS
ncbi:MAG TPA: LysR family transcriptional regulator, partial [Pseudomonas sp.]|nr:LysR family transcriptional regulator [Pseudomonas sp.]